MSNEAARAPRFCDGCGRQLPKRAYRKTCASCRKIAAGWERVRIAWRLLPGFVHVFRYEWRRKVDAA